MGNSIRLHSKYGVNPTIPTCFWCGEDKNEVALLGAAYKGEAPRHMILDYEPCDGCKANMEKGIALIEAERTWDGPKFTGRWMVMKEEAIRRVFTGDEQVDAMLRHRKAYLEPEAYKKLLEIYAHVQAEPESGDLGVDRGETEGGDSEGSSEKSH